MKKKLRIKFTCLDKRGIVLIKTLIGLLIISIVLLAFIKNILLIARLEVGYLHKNKFDLDGEYALDYIGKEIKNSIAIVATDLDNNYKYKDNIGFYIVRKGDKLKYNIITYYLDREVLKRVAFENNTIVGLNNVDNRYLGINKLLDGVTSLDKSYYDEENKYIRLDFQLKGKNFDKNFNKIIYYENEE